jgi:hypothetical protein
MDLIDLNGALRTIPIAEPEVSHTIGLIVSDRFPVQPAVATLLDEARAFSPAGLLPAA